MSGTDTGITTTGGKAMSDQVTEQASNTARTSESELRETKADDLRAEAKEAIEDWAEERGGQPATVEGTEHGDHLGVLRIDFGGDSKDLRHVSWDERFKTFDTRRLNFIYQETTSDGNQSNFFRLESPDREDG
jgi:hypothetical protein